ncbi:MAG: response regulator [Candidatus Omnitrophica bacterium]|nr:response regulator [Candidatus Omnitrophota bacterium]
MLERLRAYHYDVIMLEKGRDVLDKAVAVQPDLIVLDQGMPDIPGLEVCRQLKANPVTQPIPVVMFTCFTQKGFEEKCVEAGILGIIYKPEVGELIQLIRKIFAGKKIVWGEEED